MYDDGNAVDQFPGDITEPPNFVEKLTLPEDSPWVKTMPFSITDLRTDKRVYFKAFVTGIQEKFAPQWQTYTAFARPEPYYQWISCTRQYNLKLNVYAFSAPELNVIYKKLNFLAQLQYGTYHNDGRPKEPPLCRLLLGDLIKKVNNSTSEAGVSSPFNALGSLGGNVGKLAGKLTSGFGNGGFGEGLAGFIDGLDIIYPDSDWEFEAGTKVPKSFEMNLTFNVIHENAMSGDSSFYDVDNETGIGRSQAFKDMFSSIG